MELARLLEAGHVSAGILRLGFVFQPVDLAEQRAFAKLQLGLGPVTFGFLEIGRSLFRVALILSDFLIHLVGQILILGVGLNGVVELLSAIELRKDIAHRYLGSVGRETSEG